MDTSIHNPQCFALFDPITPECVSCGIQADCMRAQEKRVKIHASKCSEQTSATTTKLKATPNPQRKKAQSKQQATPSNCPTTGDEQYIPQHTRKPLEIPPVGSKIKTYYRGESFEALIVDDPSNKRSDGRSILFNGTVYRTLTAAAHAIAPGINSGSVWQEA